MKKKHRVRPVQRPCSAADGPAASGKTPERSAVSSDTPEFAEFLEMCRARVIATSVTEKAWLRMSKKKRRDTFELLRDTFPERQRPKWMQADKAT